MKKVIASILLISLTSCAIVKYEGKPDGTTSASAYVLGNTTALENGKFQTKDRLVELNNLSNNQSDSIDKINQGLSLIIEGAVKGAK